MGVYVGGGFVGRWDLEVERGFEMINSKIKVGIHFNHAETE